MSSALCEWGISSAFWHMKRSPVASNPAIFRFAPGNRRCGESAIFKSKGHSLDFNSSNSSAFTLSSLENVLIILSENERAVGGKV